MLSTKFKNNVKNHYLTSNKAHKTDIPTPEKKNYPTIIYGKYTYYYHKDLYLLKEAHQLHKTTLSKKLRDNIMESKGRVVKLVWEGPNTRFNPPVPDIVIWVGSLLWQIAALRSLRRDCARPRDR